MQITCKRGDKTLIFMLELPLMIAGKLKQLISEAIEKAGLPAVDFTLEHPTELAHGDYALNAALIIAKKVNQNPKEVAAKIAAELENTKSDLISKIEVAGPGFINFYLTPEFFADQIGEIVKAGDEFGKNKTLAGQKIIVEHTDPNPFKEFHIGHLMTNTIGGAVSHLMQWNGAEVKQACYQGDMGLHVAKAIWGMKHSELPIETAHDLGQAYALGANKYEVDEAVKKEIEEINKQVYEGGNQEIDELYVSGRRLSLEYFDGIYKKLGTQFDYFFYESDTGPFGKQVVEDYPEVFEKSEGAVVFKGEKYGLHTRVFINKLGLPTYEAKELGLSQVKYDIYPYDQSVVVTGNEINEYFKVLLKAMELVFPKLAAKTKHLGHGMLRLPTGKMSSRTGDVITAEDMVAEVTKRLPEPMEEVAVGAIKFSILKQAIGRDIVFDIDKSISFEGDSGPYLQYTYVRTKSILEKAKELGIKIVEHPVSNNSEVSVVEKLVYRLPEVIEKAGKEYAPQQIITYLLELAAAYNNFYANNKIVDADDLAASAHRVAITAATGLALKNGLTVLGIPVPERM